MPLAAISHLDIHKLLIPSDMFNNEAVRIPSPSSPQDDTTEPTYGWALLASRVWSYAGHSAAQILTIVAVASVLEGIGLILLIPTASLVFSDNGTAGPLAEITQRIFGQFGIDQSFAQLSILCGLFLLMMLVRAAVLIRRDEMLTQLSQGFVDETRKGFFSLLAQSDWPVLKQMQRSHLLDNITTNIGRVSVVIQFFTKSLVTVMMVIAYLVIGFLTSWPIGVLLLLITGLAGMAAWIWSRRSGALGRVRTVRNRAMMDETTRFLDGLKTAQACQAVDVFVARFSESVDQARSVSVKFSREQGRLRRAVEIIGATMAVALLLTGYGLLELSGGELLLMAAVLIRLTPSLISLLSGVQSVAYALPAFAASEKIRAQLLEHRSTVKRQAGSEQPAALGPITFNGVKMNVRSDSNGEEICILQADHLTIPERGLIRLKGPSGAGKSTMAELLAGLDLPSQGSVGTPYLSLASESRDAWQSFIAFVPQEPFLFGGSVRDNLCWPNIKASDEAIWEALEQAAAKTLVLGLPDALDHCLRDGGNRLSGGERQRLCLARALLRSAQLLIIDEGTSAVDAALEEEILFNLRELGKRKSVIFVSHSPKVGAFADHSISISKEGYAELETNGQNPPHA